jgi:hypothetical protein
MGNNAKIVIFYSSSKSLKKDPFLYNAKKHAFFYSYSV